MSRNSQDTHNLLKYKASLYQKIYAARVLFNSNPTNTTALDSLSESKKGSENDSDKKRQG